MKFDSNIEKNESTSEETKHSMEVFGWPIMEINVDGKNLIFNNEQNFLEGDFGNPK